MKLLYIIDKPNLWGSERHLIDLINFFCDGNEIHLIAFDSGPMLDQLKDKPSVSVTIIKIRWFPIINLFYLYKAITSFRPDLVHAHQPKALFYGALLTRMANLRSIITVHSKAIDHAMLYHGLRYYVTLGFHYLARTLAEIMADWIICVSHDVRRTLFLKRKSEVVYNWVSPVLRPKTDYVFRANPLHNKIRILSVAALTIGKAHDLLIRLVSQLYMRFKNIELSIYGEGRERIRLESLVKELGIDHVVKFHGYSANLSSVYSSSDFFMLFSRAETFGVVYAEAMAYGLPVFCLDIPIMREIIPIGNSVSNEMLDHIDAFSKLINSPQEYNKISMANMQKCVEFDYVNNCIKTQRIYQNVINKK